MDGLNVVSQTVRLFLFYRVGRDNFIVAGTAMLSRRWQYLLLPEHFGNSGKNLMSIKRLVWYMVGVRGAIIVIIFIALLNPIIY